MILDAETLDLSNSIETDARGACAEARRRGEARADGVGAARSPRPRAATRPRRASQLRDLRARVQRRPRERGLAIGSAGTHPFAMWEDQRIVARPRYRDLVAALCASWPARS